MPRRFGNLVAPGGPGASRGKPATRLVKRGWNALLDAGARLPKNDQALRRLLSSVAKSDAPEQWVYESHVGWIRNGKAYVTINGVIGDAPAKIVGINRS